MAVLATPAPARCPCRVSSICAMSLNSRSQENAMLRCAGHVHRLTDTVGAAKQSIHRYTAQLLLPVDNRDDSSSNRHSSNSSSNLQHRQHRRIPGSFPAANGKHCLIQPAVCPAVVVASLSLPRNRNSPATATAAAPTAARLHLIKVCSRLSYSVSYSVSISISVSVRVGEFYLPGLPNDLN